MNVFRITACGATLALLLAACDASVDVSQNTTLTAAEAQMAAEVIGQAMGDQSEGMVSDLYDMDAGLEASGLAYHDGPLARGVGNFRVELGRPGNRQDGRVRYDSTTGVHRVNYERKHEGPGFYRSIKADLAYIFTDAAGKFIREPRRFRDRIATISFEGIREGETRLRRPGTSVESRSEFKREASWALAGLTGATATFRGDQTSSGKTRTSEADSTERTFTVRLRTDNVTITKSRAAQGIETALTGTIQYEVVLKRAGQEERRASGTLDVSQDGKALLRFMNVGRTYRLDLASGSAQPTG